jgi:hypothetical protein
MTQHTPDFARLLDWIENRLPTDQAAALEAWATETDQAGQAQIVWLRAFVRQSAKAFVTSVEPSSTARKNVLQSFEQFAHERRRPNLVQRLVATLLPSNNSRPALAGARGAGSTSQDQQLVYTTELADVLLNVYSRPRDQQLDVRGQVLPTSDAMDLTLTVQMLREEAEFGITTTNALGEFTFDAVAPGSYSIVVSNSTHELDIRPVMLSL